MAEATPSARPPGQPGRDIGAVFQSGPFLVTIGEAVADLASKQLYLGVRFQNLGDNWVSPGLDGVLELGGQDLTLFPVHNVLSRIAPGRTSDETFVVGTGGLDPLRDGVVRWGRDDETQTRIRLVDGAVDGFGVPRELPVDGWTQIGREAIHVTRATLYADALGAPRAENGQHVLRLVFDEYSSSPSFVNGFVPSDQVTLQLPDGTVEDALHGSTGRTLQPTWTSSLANTVDFAVPADPAGDYQARLASVSRTAMGTFHVDLIDHAPLPFTVPGATAATPAAARPTATSLPRADIPPAADATPGSAVDVDLAAGPVNVPGSVFRATHLAWAPATGTTTLSGEAQLVKPIVPPDDGLFATPSAFQPYVSLDIAGRLYDGVSAEAAVATITPDAWTPVGYEFGPMPAPDLEQASLLLGLDGMAASVLPLVASASPDADPPAPVEGTITGPAVTAGNYTVQLVGYRFGLPRELDRPPAGTRVLEVILDVTAHQVESPGSFGLLFAPSTQLFIALADGYLQPSMSADTAFFEHDGDTLRVAATYLVPATWAPGVTAFTARSRDEIRDITRDGWTEVTFAATFNPAAGAAPASPSLSPEGAQP